MLARSSRLPVSLMFMMSAAAAVCVSASEIEMNDGTLYPGVTITRRDAVSLECYSQRGKITLPVLDIAKIDGIRMSNLPDDSYGYVPLTANPTVPGPTPFARAPLRPALPLPPSMSPPRRQTATPSQPPRGVLMPSRSATSPFAPSPIGIPPRTPPPRPMSTAVIAAPATEQVAPWVQRRSLWAISLLGAGLIWILSILSVRRDLRRTVSSNPRGWMLAVILLPVVGYLAFETSRIVKRRRARRSSTAAARREFIFLDADHRPIMIKVGEEASGLQTAKDILQDALLDRASDVHIEPGATECRVRFRIDGVLQPRMKFSAEEGLRLVSALKSVAQLDISERRRAQDGRFGGRTGDRDVDFRAATTPSIYGEKLVLRVLDQKSGLRGLTDLGMNERMMERYAEIIHSRSGMILATGPTGSGKTSSLYAALSQLDTERLNVVTIEEPVEYELRGATQIPVNEKAGVTFESGLRSILRQDPDVILVGEMRDLEAAQIALRSALTGHLVFTSLHTRDAVGTLQRLEEMGIERHLLASALFVVMSQRLVRVLCPACREAYPSTGHELAEIGLELPAGETIYRAKGCRQCEGTGYIGRTGIFEMLILDEELREHVNAGASEDALTRAARTKGFQGYREHGAQKVLLGITSVEEVLKAT